LAIGLNNVATMAAENYDDTEAFKLRIRSIRQLVVVGQTRLFQHGEPRCWGVLHFGLAGHRGDSKKSKRFVESPETVAQPSHFASRNFGRAKMLLIATVAVTVANSSSEG
jgi:hypothetical protein